MHYLCPGAHPPPQVWTGSQRPGICHYSAVVTEVLGSLAFVIVGGGLLESLWFANSVAYTARNHVVSLLMGQLCQSRDFFRDLMQMVLQFNS